MEQDRIKWNERYRTRTFSPEPSGIVKRFARLAPTGRALDIAAGKGANTLFLAEKGFTVDALDVSDRALKSLSGRHRNVNPACVDLDTFDIPENRYALIINMRFLNRRLFPYIRDGLIPGGVLIFETYMEGAGEQGCRPSCRDYLLRENELLHAFLSLKILFYQEVESHGPEEPGHIASLVAVRAC